MSAPKRRINLDDAEARRRYRCPNGHVRWEATNHHYWCSYCARAWGVDGEFTEIVDKKTGESLARDDVELLEEVAGKLKQYGGRR